jgi:hypothetical protein
MTASDELESMFAPRWEKGQWWIVEHVYPQSDIRMVADRKPMFGVTPHRYTVIYVVPAEARVTQWPARSPEGN